MRVLVHIHTLNDAAFIDRPLDAVQRQTRQPDGIIIVDNGSTDGTPEVARQIAREHGADDRLDVHLYPFAIAPCGAEHLATAGDSLHSLAYYYNWSFAHVRTRASIALAASSTA